MKDFRPTVMMTKLKGIYLPCANDGLLSATAAHMQRQSAATPRPTHSQCSPQELTAVVTEEEGL